MIDWRDSSTYKEIFEEGREQGHEQGLERGLEQGLHQGKEELLGLMLNQRFSTLPTDMTARLDKLTTDQLNEQGIAMFGFNSLADLEAWLNAR